MGLFDFVNDVAEFTGDKIGKVAGTFGGLTYGSIALVLDVSESLVISAIESGCDTQQAIQEWIRDNKG